MCLPIFVVPFLGEIPIVIVGTFIRQEQRTGDIPLDGTLIGRKGEEQLVEAAHVLFRLGGSVLRQILRQGEHQRLTAIQHIDFLPLSFGKGVGTPYRIARKGGTQTDDNQSKKAYLPETCFDIL